MATKVDPITTPLASVGIDIGKEIFHVVGLGTDGKTAFRSKIKRLALKDVFEKDSTLYYRDGSLLVRTIPQIVYDNKTGLCLDRNQKCESAL